MMQIANYMIQLAQQNLLPVEAVTVAIQELLETFNFGSTQEFMQAITTGTMPTDFTKDQLNKLKIAILETMKDAGVAGQENETRMVESTKVGVLEALKESGLAEKMGGGVQDNPETAPIPYKDAPPSIQRQMEIQAGFTPAEEPSPSEITAVSKLVTATKSTPEKTPAKK